MKEAWTLKTIAYIRTDFPAKFGIPRQSGLIKTLKGKIVFAIGCGLITSLIRFYGNLPEGVSFAIVIMNIFVPHIEKLTAPKPFGTVKEKKSKEVKSA